MDEVPSEWVHYSSSPFPSLLSVGVVAVYWHYRGKSYLTREYCDGSDYGTQSGFVGSNSRMILDVTPCPGQVGGTVMVSTPWHMTIVRALAI